MLLSGCFVCKSCHMTETHTGETHISFALPPTPTYSPRPPPTRKHTHTRARAHDADGNRSLNMQSAGEEVHTKCMWWWWWCAVRRAGRRAGRRGFSFSHSASMRVCEPVDNKFTARAPVCVCVCPKPPRFCSNWIRSRFVRILFCVCILW